jgi:hypothetical protein
VPYNLEERLAMVERLKVAVKSGLALVPHWGRGSTLAAAASGSSLTVIADNFKAQPGDAVFIHAGDIEAFDEFDVAEVAVHRNRTLSLTTAVSHTYEAGARVFPTIIGRITVGELEALDDWRQAVTVEVQQLRTVPDNDAALYQFDYWLHGSPLPRIYAGDTLENWLHGSPAISP